MAGRKHFRQRRLHNRHIERLAVHDLLLRSAARSERRLYGVAGPALELGNHFLDRKLDTTRRDERDLVGVHGRNR